MNITLGDWSVNFYVESHTDVLEFVLHDAEERNGLEYGEYETRLAKMLNEALEESPAWIADNTSYGSLSYRLAAESEEELKAALPLCEKAVKAWLAKYNVKQMKERQ